MAKRQDSRIGVWVILILLFVGLIGFGATNLSGTIRSIGTAGQKEIGVQAYADALSQQIDAFSAQIGAPLSFPQAQAFGIDRAVLGQVVAAAVLDNEAHQLGLSVGDARVRDRVLQIPAFQGLSGSFDREAYRFTLDRRGMTEAEFEANLRDEISRSLLQAAVIGGTPEPTAYAEALVAFIGERRSFTWAPVTDSILTRPLPEPTEADLQAQYDANPDAYTLPEVRKITYAWLSPDMIHDTVPVDEQAIRDLYDSRIAEYVQPERRLVERLVFGDDAQAIAAAERLGAGDVDFDTLVTDRGLDLTDVDLGDVAIGDLGAAGEPVFAATPGDVVGPVLTSLGPALFRMNAILSAEEVTFDEAAPDLRAELARDRARRVIAVATSDIADLLAGGATLEDLAERTDMDLGRIDWSDADSEGIAAYDSFREAAATAAPGSFPELVEMADGGVFALRIDEIVPPTLQPLEAVREQVISDRAMTATAEAVRAQAERIATALEAGQSFEDFGLLPATETGLIRREFLAGTPQGFISQVFEMEVSQALSISDPSGLTVVVRLDRVDPADPADPAMVAERSAIAERAGSGIAQDVYGAFAGAVQARTDVRLDEAAIAAVNTNFQ